MAVAGSVSDDVCDALTRLDAQLEPVLGPAALPPEEERTGEWASSHGPLHALVYDATDAFGDGGDSGLEAALEQAWVAIREVAVGALIPAERPAKLVLLAPRPSAGPLATAATAGLENLVRTLSVEWARHRLTAVLIAPGQKTTEQELATVVCYLVSEAGGYLSGCRLDLGEVA